MDWIPRLPELVRRWGGAWATLLTFVSIAALFVMTGFLTRAYRVQRAALARQEFQEAERLSAERRYSQSLEHYRAALSLSRDNTAYVLALARTLVQLGQTKEAATYLSETLRADPTNGQANLMMARISAEQNDIESSMTYYHRAIFGYWPDDPVNKRHQVRLELADFLAENGAIKQALSELIALESEVPETPYMKRQMADRFLRYGMPERAIPLYRELTRTKDVTADTYAGLGEAYFDRAQYHEALNAYSRARTVDPQNLEYQERSNLIAEILSLDPTIRRLSTREQYRRSTVLLERATDLLRECVESMPQPPSSAAQALAAGQARLKARVTRPDSEAVELNLFALDKVWTARNETCPQQPVTDKALSILAERLTQ